MFVGHVDGGAAIRAVFVFCRCGRRGLRASFGGRGRLAGEAHLLPRRGRHRRVLQRALERGRRRRVADGREADVHIGAAVFCGRVDVDAARGLPFTADSGYGGAGALLLSASAVRIAACAAAEQSRSK